MPFRFLHETDNLAVLVDWLVALIKDKPDIIVEPVKDAWWMRLSRRSMRTRPKPDRLNKAKESALHA